MSAAKRCGLRSPDLSSSRRPNPTPLFCVLAFLLATISRAEVQVPEGFVAETLATNLNAATALAVAPDGRIFLADQTGPVRVCKDGRLLPRLALDLTGHVDDYWERGLIGLTLHPDFPRTPQAFVLYVAKTPFPHHVLSRFTVIGDQFDAASSLVLLEGDDQRRLGGKVPHGHQGGPLCFGADGKLYVALGEQTAGEPAQRLDSLLGKILRLNADGSIPEDNPFFAKTTGKYRAIWSLGHRNPFGLAVQPSTGRLFETEVGASAFEEVNEILRGANYGWPHAEGFSTNTAFQNPLHAYPPAIGRSIVGAAFCPTAGPFPEPWRGKLFFADWAANWVKALDVDAPTEVMTFAKGFDAPVTVEFAPDGSLLVLNRGTLWRDGEKWRPNSGSLVRIRYAGGGRTPVAGQQTFPRTLRATGLFASLAPIAPRAGFEEFQVNQPPWQPGVFARRWISLPENTALRLNSEDEFEFPAGSVVVQHYSVEKTGAPFETHVLWLTGPRRARAAAYRWSAEARDAALVEDGEIIPLPGDPGRFWLSPGYESALNLDAIVSGFVLPLSPRQLRGQPQWEKWLARGRVSPAGNTGVPPRAAALAALDDLTAPLELRVRSYLDVNCSACHRPGGPSRGHFDARFTTPLEQQKLIGAEPVAGDLGIAGAKLIVPGDPDKSVLLQRVRRDDAVRMPPINVNPEPQPIVPLLRQWILDLRARADAAPPR